MFKWEKSKYADSQSVQCENGNKRAKKKEIKTFEEQKRRDQNK